VTEQAQAPQKRRRQTRLRSKRRDGIDAANRALIEAAPAEIVVDADGRSWELRRLPSQFVPVPVGDRDQAHTSTMPWRRSRKRSEPSPGAATATVDDPEQPDKDEVMTSSAAPDMSVPAGLAVMRREVDDLPFRSAAAQIAGCLPLTRGAPARTRPPPPAAGSHRTADARPHEIPEWSTSTGIDAL
jgi:hypothetical protein